MEKNESFGWSLQKQSLLKLNGYLEAVFGYNLMDQSTS